MTLAHALAQPLARIGRSLVWTTDDETMVVKYVRCEGAIRPHELEVAGVAPQGTTPAYYGEGTETRLPTGEYGPWRTMWYERFPKTLLEWGKKLDAWETAELFLQVRALHFAGIYHRDIHARNIVLRRVEGRVMPDIRLIDFGRARCSVEIDERIIYEQDDWRAFEYSALRRLITVRRGEKEI